MSPVLPLPAGDGDTDAYLERSDRWLERNGLDIEADPELDAEAAVERGFARLDVGLFDVRIPVQALADDGWLAELGDVAGSLLEAQIEWTAWLWPNGDPSVRASDLRAHTKSLASWLKSWRTKQFRDPEALRGVDLLDATDAKPKVREASEFFSSLLRSGGPKPEPGKEPVSPRLLLLPERAEFVEFMSLVGRLEKRHTPYFWIPESVTWTHFEFDGTRALALEFATPDAQRDYRRSIAMSSKNPAAAREHVVQLAMRSLLDYTYGQRMEPMLAAGLASNLVIAVFDEVDTRTDGDTRGRTTEARSVFIPGGNPNGGALPTNNADSRWRESKGKDHFVGVLQNAQKAGGKTAEEKWQKLASFELLDDDQSQRHTVHAPFLGASMSKPPPAAFAGDYAEFLRAYRSAFLFWLVEESGKGAKLSRSKFGELLQMMATSEKPLPEQFSSVYGVPLSSGGADLVKGECLEGRFLKWLSK